MVANPHLESFAPDSTAPDSTAAWQSEYFNSTIGNRLVQNAVADVVPPTVSDAVQPVATGDRPQPPQGIDAASWQQVSEWIGAGKDVKFTAPAEGQVADYILGTDGKLVKNPAKTTPSPDGSVTIEVQSDEGKVAAQKAAQQLQIAAVQEKIYYWQLANPGNPNIPEYLKGMLSSAENMQIDTAPVSPERAQPVVQPQPQEVAAAPQPSPGRGGFTGGGGGAPQRVGNANIGSAPERGHRPGSFEPNGPIDRTAIPKPVEGDLPIKGPPTSTVDQIQTFLEKMGSPAAKEEGFSQALYDACTERGIDPSVAVGFFLQESTCGRYGRATENRSLGNIKGTAPESGGTDGSFRRYDTWAEGARDWARLIDEAYVQKRGLSTLSQVISVYAPSSDGNNESRYVATVKGVVEQFKQQNNGAAVA